MNCFKKHRENAAVLAALLQKTDELIARADALIAALEGLDRRAGEERRERDLTDGLYGILSYSGKGEADA